VRIVVLITALSVLAACGADGKPETPPAKANIDNVQNNAAEAMG